MIQIYKIGPSAYTNNGKKLEKVCSLKSQFLLKFMALKFYCLKIAKFATLTTHRN